MKTLYLDIETSPMDIKTWGVWEQNALKIENEWVILGMSYAWDDGKPKLIYPDDIVAAKFLEHRNAVEATILGRIWTLLDEADLVIGHNSDKFDLKKINARLVRAGYGPPSPYLTVDTLKVARQRFAFTKNSLDYLGQYLGVGGKLKHTGLQLWLDCVNGDPKAWKLMKKYNKQDVILQRDVYKRLLPWINGHPHMGGEGCPICGSLDSQRRGNRTMKSGIKYVQHQCNDCGSYYRDRKAESSPSKRV